MELVEKYGFISMIGVKIMQFDITNMTYNALFEVIKFLLFIHTFAVINIDKSSF